MLKKAMHDNLVKVISEGLMAGRQDTVTVNMMTETRPNASSAFTPAKRRDGNIIHDLGAI